MSSQHDEILTIERARDAVQRACETMRGEQEKIQRMVEESKAKEEETFKVSGEDHTACACPGVCVCECMRDV